MHQERDGYLTQQDMLQAAPYLVKGASVRVVGYLERTHGDIHLHDGARFLFAFLVSNN